MTPRERFLRYVTYYTTSDDFSETAPSTERQKELIRELAREMEELGLKDISFDSNSNVYGTLPANGRSRRKRPSCCYHLPGGRVYLGIRRGNE